MSLRSFVIIVLIFIGACEDLDESGQNQTGQIQEYSDTVLPKLFSNVIEDLDIVNEFLPKYKAAILALNYIAYQQQSDAIADLIDQIVSMDKQQTKDYDDKLRDLISKVNTALKGLDVARQKTFSETVEKLLNDSKEEVAQRKNKTIAYADEVLALLKNASGLEGDYDAVNIFIEKYYAPAISELNIISDFSKNEKLIALTNASKLLAKNYRTSLNSVTPELLNKYKDAVDELESEVNEKLNDVIKAEQKKILDEKAGKNKYEQLKSEIRDLVTTARNISKVEDIKIDNINNIKQLASNAFAAKDKANNLGATDIAEWLKSLALESYKKISQKARTTATKNKGKAENAKSGVESGSITDESAIAKKIVEASNAATKARSAANAVNDLIAQTELSPANTIAQEAEEAAKAAEEARDELIKHKAKSDAKIAVEAAKGALEKAETEIKLIRSTLSSLSANSVNLSDVIGATVNKGRALQLDLDTTNKLIEAARVAGGEQDIIDDFSSRINSVKQTIKDVFTKLITLGKEYADNQMTTANKEMIKVETAKRGLDTVIAETFNESKIKDSVRDSQQAAENILATFKKVYTFAQTVNNKFVADDEQNLDTIAKEILNIAEAIKVLFDGHQIIGGEKRKADAKPESAEGIAHSIELKAAQATTTVGFTDDDAGLAKLLTLSVKEDLEKVPKFSKEYAEIIDRTRKKLLKNPVSLAFGLKISDLKSEAEKYSKDLGSDSKKKEYLEKVNDLKKAVADTFNNHITQLNKDVFIAEVKDALQAAGL